MATKSVREIIDEHGVNTETILAYINEGLEARYLGLIVYDTNIHSQENEDTIKKPPIPSLEERNEAQRKYVLNQMCEERGQPTISDLSKYPDGYYGISFTLPKNIEERKRVDTEINEFRIVEEEFLEYHSPVFSEERNLAKIVCKES